jgi:hypothetical protein
MARHRKPAPPPIPDPILARQRAQTEQYDQKHEQRQTNLKARDQLVRAGILAESLGAAFELDQKANKAYLRQWVKALAAYKAELTREMLDRLAGPPAGLSDDDRDAWHKAVQIFLVSDTDQAGAVAVLRKVAELPDFCISVGRWLRRGIRAVAEDHWIDPTPTVAGTGERQAEPAESLSERQKDLLRALLRLKAVGPRSRVSVEKAAMKVDPAGKSGSYKNPISALARLGLVQSKKGPGGGIWLTASGKAEAEQLPPSHRE